jgi:hypothetical protein
VWTCGPRGKISLDMALVASSDRDAATIHNERRAPSFFPMQSEVFVDKKLKSRFCFKIEERSESPRLDIVVACAGLDRRHGQNIQCLARDLRCYGVGTTGDGKQMREEVANLPPALSCLDTMPVS